jgi:hypothetical protein
MTMQIDIHRIFPVPLFLADRHRHLLVQNRVFGFTLYMSSDYTLVPFTYNRIAFPIADSGLLGNNSRALLNTDAVGGTSPRELTRLR